MSDFNNDIVFKVSLDFRRWSTLIGGDLRRPSGLAVDDTGNLLVADNRNDAIKVFSPDGHFVHSITTLGHLKIELPTDIAMGKAGFIAIADCNGRISIV